jgi:tryptophanase
MNNDDVFFSGLEANKPEVKPEVAAEIKTYPAWVEQSRNTDKTRVMYDIVVRLFNEAAEMIKNKTFSKATEVTLSQTQVCEEIPFLKGRSGLKNHKKIIDEIDIRNIELVKLLATNKKKTGKSTARKTINMVKAELSDYKAAYVAKTQIELDRLINSELLISQSEALNKISKYKVELTLIRKELAEAQHANTRLQDENFRLQQRVLTKNKPKSI